MSAFLYFIKLNYQMLGLERIFCLFRVTKEQIYYYIWNTSPPQRNSKTNNSLTSSCIYCLYFQFCHHDHTPIVVGLLLPFSHFKRNKGTEHLKIYYYRLEFSKICQRNKILEISRANYYLITTT